MYALAELERKLENLITIGKVVEVDYPTKKMRVNIEQDDDDELTSFWMPIPAEIGRNFKRWLPVRIGTQMILACPSGDLANAVPTGMLYTQDLDSPSTNEEIDLIEFDDGSQIKYDSGAHRLTIESIGDLVIVSGAVASITAADAINLQAPQINMVGPVSQSGGDVNIADTITAKTDVVVGATSLADHVANPSAHHTPP